MAHEAPFPSVRFLQLKAKSLHKGYPQGDPWALRLFEKHWRGPLPAADSVSMADCYRLLATAFRCRQWGELKRGIELMEEIRCGRRPRLSDADHDLLVAMMGTYYPVSFWAHRLVEQAPRGLEAVLRGLQHRNPRVRQACSQYVDHRVTSWDPITYAALADALDDENSRVRASILHTMGCARCKTDPLAEEAVELFLHGADDESPRVRRTALAGLHRFRDDPRSRRAYLRALDDENSRVRQAAAAALARYIDDPAVASELLALLERETCPRVVRAALASFKPAADRMRGVDRRPLERDLGPPLETARRAGKPDSHFYPTEGLVPGARASGAPRCWVRVVYDAESRASSVTVRDSIQAL